MHTEGKEENEPSSWNEYFDWLGQKTAQIHQLVFLTEV